MAGVDVVRRFYAVQRRFYAGEEVATELRDLLAPEIAWHVPGRSAIAGHYHGHDDVLAYFARRRARADRTFSVTPVALLADEQRVVQLADGHAVIDGRPRGWRTVGIYELAGERIGECWLLPFDQYEFDAIWR